MPSAAFSCSSSNTASALSVAGSSRTTSSFLSSYEPLEVIGKGTFGLIRKVRRRSDDIVFARKEINFERMSQRDREQIVTEVNILRNLQHTNIVQYEDRHVDRDNATLYIVMEYCEGGDLGSKIKECRKNKRMIAEDVVLSYLAQMVQGLHSCHNANALPGPDGLPTASRVILHRDLKPENIFLDGQETIKIGDFGLSKEMTQHDFAQTYVGTPYYMSPELAEGRQYDVKSDIWALGCVAYELCGLRPPFDATTQAELTRKIQLGHVPELPRGYSSILGDVIRSMLSLDPSKRPTTKMLLQHSSIRRAIRRREELRVQEDRCKRTAELDEREQALTRRQQGLDERETALRKQEVHIQTVLAQLQHRERDVIEREKALLRAKPEAVLHPSPSSAPNTAVLRERVPRRESFSAQSFASSARKVAKERRGSMAPLGTASTVSSLQAQTIPPLPNRMQSSPCVVMGASPFVDTSDISMRDASAWLHTGNASSAHEAGSDDNKENPEINGVLPRVSTPLRNRQSSPTKVMVTQKGVAAAAPFTSVTSSAGNLSLDDESLPSPFLRKIVRTQSQPASDTANVMRDDDTIKPSSVHPAMTNLLRMAATRAANEVKNSSAGVFSDDFGAASTSASSHRSSASRKLSAMPRRTAGLSRRNSTVAPGSVGVAPLGRKSNANLAAEVIASRG